MISVVTPVTLIFREINIINPIGTYSDEIGLFPTGLYLRVLTFNLNRYNMEQ